MPDPVVTAVDHTDDHAEGRTSDQSVELGELIQREVLVEEVSIDGMCGVY
jgi:mycofactocin precursor